MQRQSHIMNRTLVDFEKERPLYSEQEVADLAFYFSSWTRPATAKVNGR